MVLCALCQIETIITALLFVKKLGMLNILLKTSLESYFTGSCFLELYQQAM